MAQGSLQISNLSLRFFSPSEMRRLPSRIVVCDVRKRREGRVPLDTSTSQPVRSLHESQRRWLHYQMKFRRRRAKPLPGVQDQPIDRYSQ
ncbi:hypothetical protein NEUTE1DRAFT_117805 [Neurospora tetrasperma FGSC 2508]|uniref:Uncharacterized protein n=1 Tax=Neurospora tetrasperma (strain FGSC 2508 / ATCC MYA-4615 / P0657) TaxID=510951 RepID=F8MU36_NEUT8|nr:uncharacterized protein NEUTE1DRAFT_117805 [Neurospora tetrasperma FGSC 2508]EGO55518.1 hypothetical protein NEUTE1DRAFT_117805 [Neurospora tetrasperma FGSC 2508]EGZ69241.1 hypothetical protein NEUTE2DRAFT_145487 [Neurospora tetrasperma FGSC 2509]